MSLQTLPLQEQQWINVNSQHNIKKDGKEQGKVTPCQMNMDRMLLN